METKPTQIELDNDLADVFARIGITKYTTDNGYHDFMFKGIKYRVHYQVADIPNNSMAHEMFIKAGYIIYWDLMSFSENIGGVGWGMVVKLKPDDLYMQLCNYLKIKPVLEQQLSIFDF